MSIYAIIIYETYVFAYFYADIESVHTTKQKKNAFVWGLYCMMSL